LLRVEHIGRPNPDRCCANHCRNKSFHDDTSRRRYLQQSSASKVQSNRGNCRTCLLPANYCPLIAKIPLVDYVSGGAPTSRIWPIRNFRGRTKVAIFKDAIAEELAAISL
jgi:hypothetical protein